ncbi:exonuclease SbcC [Paenibacillus sp. V4I9]|uniref:AAA family ATPase n=1 Tax=Paenibacillus sp. V4I9 TaxID=3042308 RepID=UPI00277ECF93|nr:SMC family ATPase [Paenibacillus sp. V4I9]MDQ0888911.1 exonuclease SbcC [Paenibacillus sp. V4I9]
MNIDRIKIKNFRNYEGIHEFNLRKQITILYAPNGYGKSSFFDALEWCIYGNIGRYDNHESLDDRDIINHKVLDNSNECSVEIEFAGNILRRSFSIKSGKVSNNKIELTPNGGSIIRGVKNVNAFLNEEPSGDIFNPLFKQSFILSQDQVNDFISKDNPKDRFFALADIMGLKNYLLVYFNAKEVLSKVKSHNQNLFEKIEKIKELKEVRKNDQININILDIESNLKKFGFTINFMDAINSIQELQRSTINEQNVQNNILNIFLNLKELGYKFVNEGFKHIKDIDVENQVLQQKINDLSTLNNRVLKLKSNLTEVATTYSITEKLNKSIAEKSEQIKTIGLMNDISIEEIQTDLISKRTRESKLEFAILYKDSYINNNQVSIDFIKKRDELFNKELLLSKRRIRLEKLKANVNELLNITNQGKLSKLNENVTNIYDYIKKNDVNGVCPVCSATHENNLERKIEVTLKQYQNELIYLTNRTNKLLNKEKFINKKFEINSQSLKTLNVEKEGLNLKNQAAKQQLKSIEENDLFDKTLFASYEKEELINKKKIISIDIEKIEKSVNILFSLSSEKKELTSLLDQIGLKKFTTELLSNSRKRILNLDKAAKRINSYIERLTKTRHQKNDTYNMFLNNTKINNIPIELRSLEVQKVILDTENKLLFIEEKLSMVSNLSEVKSNMELNNKIKKELTEYDKSIDDIQRDLNNGNSVFSSINSFLEQMNSALGGNAENFLNTPSSSIQKYYRFLNPLPTNDSLQFEVDNGELRILYPVQGKDETYLSNARHTLSSAQLNILAISVFLATNDSQGLSKLKFVAIDDPIQNMDDINKFSICDVLGSLEKQLIFSTHDLDFLKLFVKKNEYQKEKIQVFQLQSPHLKEGRVKNIVF